MRASVDKLQPDVVYVHNLFDGRVLQALGKPGRSYALLMYIHDHYLTCLTELRARHDEKNVCQERLFSNCLKQIAKGVCVKRHADRSYSTEDLQARKQLLESIRYSDALVVISPYMKEVLQSNMPAVADRIHILPRQIRQPAHPPVRSARDAVHIGYVGRIAHEKGLHVALDALRHLPVNQPISFSVAGVQENKAYWEQCRVEMKEIQRAKPTIRLRYLGDLSYEGVDRLYGSLDILLVPTIWAEPFCATGAEALAHGVVVIASEIGGIPTYLKDGETGILAPPRDAKALSAALERVMKEPRASARVQENGRSLIATQFTSEKHFEALRNLVGQIKAAMRYA